MELALFADIYALDEVIRSALKKAIKGPVNDSDPSVEPAAAPTTKPSAPVPAKTSPKHTTVLDLKGKNG